MALAGGAMVGLGWHFAKKPTCPADYIGYKNCAACHEKETNEWLGCDHERAMDIASEKTVVGDFNNREFLHNGVPAKMTRQGDRFLMTLDGPDGKLTTYPVKYTFGVRPLQQYLAEFPGGRLQCLPIAWDTKKKEWFHVYGQEKIPAGDELHWTKPAQNWNYMCAECHTTNLRKNYDFATNAYHTKFDEINVSCETCHGPGSVHSDRAESWWPRWHWAGTGLAPLKSDDSHVEIETCAPCHARRRIVYPGFKPGDKFLDYYLPNLLDGDEYYPDGQIRDEDFEYSSFVQSKMYHNNVRCTNCHNPHTQRVKFKDGPVIRDNRLCGQCHVAAKYDAPSHHHHPEAKKPGEPSGTLCIECHMPTTPYMQVDPRLDHSIRIPRPDLTVALGIPNACTKCHHDEKKGETPAWAEAKTREWYGPRKGPPHFAHAIAGGRQGKPEAVGPLEAVARRKDLPALVRASALMLLGRYGPTAAEAAAVETVDNAEPLIRYAAVHAMEDVQPPDERLRRLRRTLHDPIRSVRTEAARVLSSVPRNQFEKKDLAAFDVALKEFIEGLQVTADRPGAHLAMGVIYSNQGDAMKAEQAYLNGLKVDPDFWPIRDNLARLYASTDRPADAERELRKVTELAPNYANGYFSLGLLVSENQKRLGEALELFNKAANLEPNNPTIQCNRGLALMHLKRFEEAEAPLLRARQLAPNNIKTLQALLSLYEQTGRRDKMPAIREDLMRLSRERPIRPVD